MSHTNTDMRLVSIFDTPPTELWERAQSEPGHGGFTYQRRKTKATKKKAQQGRSSLDGNPATEAMLEDRFSNPFQFGAGLEAVQVC